MIDHKDPSIRITTTVKYDTGESTDTLSLTTDGKEVRDTIKAMGMERERTVTARWDGGRLVTSMKLGAEGPTAEVNDSWALAENGTALTLVRVVQSAQGQFTLKTVYKKE